MASGPPIRPFDLSFRSGRYLRDRMGSHETVPKVTQLRLVVEADDFDEAVSFYR